MVFTGPAEVVVARLSYLRMMGIRTGEELSPGVWHRVQRPGSTSPAS